MDHRFAFDRPLVGLAAALLVGLASPAGVVAQAQDDDSRETRARTAYFLEVLPAGSAEKAMVKYNDWAKVAGGNIPMDGKFSFDQLTPGQQDSIKQLMVDMYGAAGGGAESFKNVALLIAKGLEHPSEAFKKAGHSGDPIPNGLSVLMAQARDLWIEEAIIQVAEKKKWRIARSDSGNTTSGMKSDLDQTFYVWEWDEGTKDWKRVLDEKRNFKDGEFIKLFEAQWKANNPALTIEMLDIASIEGRNRFPDPRAIEIADYGREFRRTIAQLRNTPGAYTTYGAVLQQMQLRALGGIIAAAKNPNDPTKRRAFQTYEPPDGVEPNAKWEKSPEFKERLALETMFGENRDPKLMQGLAFGAAVANTIELQHYMNAKKFETKYHLRTWDDGLFTSARLAEIVDADGKPDYTKLTDAERTAFNETLLAELFDGDLAAQRRHQVALDASAHLRNIHKEDYEKVPGLAGKDPKSLTEHDKQRAAFEQLATELYQKPPDRYRPDATDSDDIESNKRLLDAAEQHHRQLANEFCLASIYHTSVETAGLLFAREGPDAGWIETNKIRHAVQGTKPMEKSQAEYDAEWERIKPNLREGAHETLTYCMYDLGETESAKLRDHLKESYPKLSDEIDQLWKNRNWHVFKGMIDNRGAYARYYTNLGSAGMTQLNEHVQRHVMTELGFDHVEDARMAGRWLQGQEMTWNFRKFARNAVWDAGSADAIAQVVRAFFESGGDPETVAWKVADEMFLALPLIGQVESARRGGLWGVTLMGGAMAVPQVGVALLVYNIGEAFYAIYDLEYVRPQATNVVEGVFRGFVGPERLDLGEAGRAGATWDDVRQKELDDLKKLVATQTSWVHQSSAKLTKPALASVEREIAILETQRAAAQASGGGAWQGGKITGANAQLEQKFIETYLLADVRPRIGYFTKATVDLRRLYQLDRKEARERIAELEDRVANAETVFDRLEASVELHETTLALQRNRAARKWTDRAEENREIEYRLKRDSLFLYLRQKYRNTTDQQVEKWVDEWLAENEQQVLDDLFAAGVIDQDARAWRKRLAAMEEAEEADRVLLGDDVPPPLRVWPTNPIDVDQLKAYAKAEVARSRSLFAIYKKQEEERLAVNRRNLDLTKTRYGMEMTRPRPEHLTEDEHIRNVVAACRWAAVPRHAPELDATIYKVWREAKTSAATSGGEGEAPYEWRVATEITTDSTLYFPPYGTKSDFVDAKTARAGLSSGAINGVPLLPRTSRDLEKALAGAKAGDEGAQDVVAVVSAFADGMADLSGAMPETYAHVPRVPVGVGGTQRYLMAQSVVLVPAEPEEEVVEATPEEELPSEVTEDGYAIAKLTRRVRTAAGMCGVGPEAMVDVKITHVTKYFMMERLYLDAQLSHELKFEIGVWKRGGRRQRCTWQRVDSNSVAIIGQGMTNDESVALFRKIEQGGGSYGRTGYEEHHPDHETVIQMQAKKIYENVE